MKIYVPMVYWEVDEFEKEICDVVFHGFYTLEDAKMIYPNAEIIEVDTEAINPHAN